MGARTRMGEGTGALSPTLAKRRNRVRVSTLTSSLATNAVGTAAAVCSVLSFTPQIIKIIRTREVEGVSIRTYLITVTGFALWIAYGVRLAAWPITIANTLALIMSGTVLLLSWRYGDREGPGKSSPNR